MVRRERALRKLRGRVDLDFSSLESGENKIKGWTRKIFHPRNNTASSDVPLTPVKGNKPDRDPSGKKISTSTEQAVAETEATREIPLTPSGTTIMEISESEEDAVGETAVGETAAVVTQNPAPTTRTKARKPQPRALRLLPTAPEGVELVVTQRAGGHSPSSFARERMREIASQNAPFEDPDLRRPKCKLMLCSSSSRKTLLTMTLKGDVLSRVSFLDSHKRALVYFSNFMSYVLTASSRNSMASAFSSLLDSFLFYFIFLLHQGGVFLGLERSQGRRSWNIGNGYAVLSLLHLI